MLEVAPANGSPASPDASQGDGPPPTDSPLPKAHPRVSINVPGILTALGLIAIWEIVSETNVLHTRYLPAPSAIVADIPTLVTKTPFGSSLGHTLAVTLLGWLVASLLGVGLGIALGLSEQAWRWSFGTIEVLRALPAVAFVPVAILILGLSSTMEFVIVLYVALWPVVINTIGGVRGVSPLLKDVARTLKLKRSLFLRRVILPAALGPITVGLRLALTLSLVLAIVAEMIGNPAGLGYQLVFQQQAFHPTLMFAYVVTIGLVGVILNAAMIALTHRILPGMPVNRAARS